MKKITKAFAICLALLAAGCEKIQIALPGNSSPVFKATFLQGTPTRTQLDTDEATVLWSEGDEISIFDGDGANVEYISTVSSDRTTADFNPVSSEGLSDPEVWYSFYPYQEGASIDGSTITATMPSEYSVSAPGSFADGMNLAVASSSTLTLPFKSILGWIRVAVKGVEGVTKIVFSGNSGETLAGTISVDADDLSVAVTGDASSKITLSISDFQESESRDSRQNYYIPTLPITYEAGFTVRVYVGTTSYTYSYSGEVTFVRSQARGLFVDLGDVDPDEDADIDPGTPGEDDDL